MLTTQTRGGKTTAVLENAHNVGYKRNVNKLNTASFQMPVDDAKNKHIKALEYVNIFQDSYDYEYIDDNGVKKTINIPEEDIGLFRVLPKETSISNSGEYITYQLEHVLGTLIGDVLFKYHELDNYTTREVIEYVLNQQEVKHWQLGRCDFNYRLSYSWSNENALTVLFSIPKYFIDPYIWTFDTSDYPWTINLEKIDLTPTARIVEGYNLESIRVTENPDSLWNRIYPLGNGEGVNQVDIRPVNNGVPYIEDTESIQKYGIYKYIYIDREITDARKLKDAARKFLEESKEPYITSEVTAVELFGITGLSFDKFTCGKVIIIPTKKNGLVKALITEESKSDMYGQPYSIQLTLSNTIEDIQSNEVQQKRKQQIEERYSQGATNIMPFAYQDNCDANNPATFNIYVDDDVVNVNTCELTFETKPFRAYSSTTKSGGDSVKSTGGGGATVGTTATDGGSSQTSASGGSTTRTSSSDGEHNHLIALQAIAAEITDDRPLEWNDFVVKTGSGTMRIRLQTSAYTPFSVWKRAENHSHSITIPAHTHGFNIPNHSHKLTLDDHNHTVNIPAHQHDVRHEIIELDFTPSTVTITVDGNTVPGTATSRDRLNIIDYLSKDADGKVTRGKHEIKITPSGLARIEANLILRVFIQSQLGGKY